MSRGRRIRLLFRYSVGLLTAMSAAILLMPLIHADFRVLKIAGICSGAIFWVACLGGYGLLAVAEYQSIQLLRRSGTTPPSKRMCLGMFAFFGNPPAIAADIALVVSLTAMLLLQGSSYRNSYISYVVLFVLILSLNMHCLFNGRIYKITQNRNSKEKNA